MTTSSYTLLILDIGHGNCTILTDGDEAIIIDCASADIALQTLQDFGISKIHTIIMSHADADHIKGFPTLLEDSRIKVENIYYNPDSTKVEEDQDDNIWEDTINAVTSLADRNEANVSAQLNANNPRNIDFVDLELQVIGPSLALASLGAGSKRKNNPDKSKKPSIKSNSMSAVIRIVYGKRPIALIPGDLDRIGLQDILDRRSADDLKADILVFPHHGGNTGANNRDFAAYLCTLVEPNVVVFSMARNPSGRSKNPVKEIVEGVKAVRPNAHIICTQLSQNCSDSMLLANFDHLSAVPAAGKDSCCGGSIIVEFDNTNLEYRPLDAHKETVRNNLPNRLCKI